MLYGLCVKCNITQFTIIVADLGQRKLWTNILFEKCLNEVYFGVKKFSFILPCIAFSAPFRSWVDTSQSPLQPQTCFLLYFYCLFIVLKILNHKRGVIKNVKWNISIKNYKEQGLWKTIIAYSGWKMAWHWMFWFGSKRDSCYKHLFNVMPTLLSVITINK